MKKLLSTLLSVAALTLALQSCHVGASGSWKNDNIPPDVKKEIAVIDQKLFKAIMTQDIAGVRQLMSPVLIEKAGKTVDTIVHNIGGAFKATDYELLDEYYTKNSTTKITNTIPAVKGTDNDYVINYLALNEEMYVSLIISKNIPVNFLVMAIYGKYSDGWKLNILQIGEYNILGKTAPDYYTEALNAYKKGNLIDATNLISTTAEIAMPGGAYFKYSKDAEMKVFYTKVLKEANTLYHLPLVLTQVKTIPQIFSISPQMLADPKYRGIFPIVKYKSGVNLTDTIALKAENDAMQKVIGKVFKGIDENKAFILYQAFNQVPNGKSLVKHYGFIQKLK
ncbi:hypothetical protein [Mucilaginibacter polytrichastri]|uniref:Uncharacterized protein n=1 Tax=Mucilaginibacter polytrichastri TaxID=1302689 RepID=A0A1Q5ZVI0_9SPHI|nr:hypothetical protein [Mucilaginibacter polytrichastri]OKS85777.1 hypothetical protein RG47T_1223 [Mucilaginibacter polytrichastri]SFS61561.1 hypothetical protein SAMN04487890_102352 [Mucilaginibacter polytrichastri]